MKTTGTSLTRNAEVAVMGPTTGGTELVTNGTFDTDVSNWVEFQANSSITFSSGTAIISSNQYNDVRQVLSLVEGRRYRASMDVITRTSGAWFFLLEHDGTLSFVQGSFPDGSTQTFDFTAGAVNTLRIYPYTTTNPDTIKVDNISVRELYPFEQYNPSEGTVVCDFERIGNTAFDYVWSFDDRTDQEVMSVLSLNATHVYFGHATGGANGLTFKSYGVEAGEPTFTAYAYKQDSTHIALGRPDLSGIQISFTDTSIGVASVDKLGIGVRPRDEVGQGNCLIKRLTYYPYRLNDDVSDSKVTS